MPEEKIKNLLSFFVENHDYFSGPYANEEEFASWLGGDIGSYKEYRALGSQLSKVANEEAVRKEYQTAVTRLSENDLLMAQFLEKYPSITNFFLEKLAVYKKLIVAWHNWCLLNFFKKHVGFFAEPFFHKDKMEEWLKRDKESSRIYKALNAKFLGLMEEKARVDYMVAITGGVFHPMFPDLIVRQESGLVHGNEGSLSEFIEKNLAVKDFLLNNVESFESLIFSRLIFKINKNWEFFSEFFANKIKFKTWLEDSSNDSEIYPGFNSELLELMTAITQFEDEFKSSKRELSEIVLQSENCGCADEKYFLLIQFLLENRKSRDFLVANLEGLILSILCQFLVKNCNFFLAPFKNKRKFKKWMETASEETRKLDKDFLSLMDEVLLPEYKYAITGEKLAPQNPNLRIKEEGGVIDGKCFLLIDFFDKNRELKDFLFANFRQFKKSIEAWDEWCLQNKAETRAVDTGHPNHLIFFPAAKRKTEQDIDREPQKAKLQHAGVEQQDAQADSHELEASRILPISLSFS